MSTIQLRSIPAKRGRWCSILPRGMNTIRPWGRRARRPFMRRLVASLAGLALFPILGLAPALAAIQFQDATAAAGIQDLGQTWGAVWGDANGDGYADVWLTKHQFAPTVFYRNNANGTFGSALGQVLSVDDPNADTHGAAWADIDNDGDDDLLEAAGAGGGAGAASPTVDPSWRNNLYVNTGGHFEERAQALGLDDPRARARGALWFDYSGDGNLDVVEFSLTTDSTFPSAVFRNTPSGYVLANTQTGFNGGSCYYGALSDFSGDGKLDLVCADYSIIRKVYDVSTIPFLDLRSQIGQALFNAFPFDLAIADFNGDLRPDVFGARGAAVGSVAVPVGNNMLHSEIISISTERGLSFTTTGDVIIEFGWFTAVNNIFIGAGGQHPSTSNDSGPNGPGGFPHRVRLTLSSSNSQTFGLAAHNPGVTSGVYIGFDGSKWQVRVSNIADEFGMLVTAPAISGIAGVGGVSLDQGANVTNILLINQNGTLLDRSSVAGLGAIRSSCQSAVAGDFDNDMDVDVYLGCAGDVANLPNILFENLGNATFAVVPNAGGAVGDIRGRVDSVTSVDYDRDGALDLFVTNGAYPPPFAYSGRQQLFRNTGSNGNHWVEVNLEGVTSNRDAIGASVIATTPDGKRQLREQGGAMHKYAQNDRPLHFGLGQNSLVSLQVRWPSGRVDDFANLPADRPHLLREGSEGLRSGDECGVPAIQNSTDKAIFLYRDCSTTNGVWTVRATSGGSPTPLTYGGTVTSVQAMSNVSSFSFEGGDILSNSPATQIGYKLNMWAAGVDGFSFRTAGENVADKNCFAVTSLPAGAQVLVGPQRKSAAVAFNLNTFGACN